MGKKRASIKTVAASRAVRIILTLLLILACAVLAFSASFYSQALVDAFFAFALASVLIIHLRIHSKWPDVLLVIAITFALGSVDFRLLHYAPKLMAWLSFAGLSSFLVMAVHTVWAREPGASKALLCAWVPAALFIISDYFASTMLEWTSAVHPKTLDLYLLSFDYSLRVPIVFIAGRIYQSHPWLHNASLLVYVGLAIPISLVYAGLLVRFKRKAFPAMLAFLITGPLGILFYNLFPACGPQALFQHGFPLHPFPMDAAPRLHLESMVVAGPRNAIPSLHMAWVLLAWWYSRGLTWFERLIVLIFLVFTIFATLGTGEHWFVDLIVAFPFALSIQAIAAYPLPWKDGRRAAGFLFGLLCTLAWLVMLRYEPKFFWTSPLLPWLLATTTVVLTIIRQANLDRAVDPTNYVESLSVRSARLHATKVSLPAN
ncbi:MAG TPA: phosphatase PAP2 family protein [Candidatus Acidoferrales bacterium]